MQFKIKVFRRLGYSITTRQINDVKERKSMLDLMRKNIYFHVDNDRRAKMETVIVLFKKGKRHLKSFDCPETKKQVNYPKRMEKAVLFYSQGIGKKRKLRACF